MKRNKVIGVLLLLLAISTILGVKLNNATYWLTYNYVTVALSIICSYALLRQK